MDDGDLGSWITQMPDNLVGSVVGNRDDVVRALSRIVGQGREALAKFRCRVIAGKHEQIVEGGDTAPPLAPRQPLVQTVKDSGTALNQKVQRPFQQPTRAVGCR